jgi:pimeloyl-ACP methyl ester carboxylesterase
VGSPEAPPILLVMGLALSYRGWSTLPEALAERFRVIALSNRGTGDSTCPRGFFSMRDMADDAIAVLDAERIDRAVVFGVSMGGMISQELALAYPERVRALVLGATHAGWLKSRHMSPATLREFVKATVLGRRARLASSAHILVSDEYYAAHPREFAAWLREAQPAGPKTTLRQMTAVMRYTTERRLPDLRIPTLVITGDADRLVPAENSRVLADLIPGAKLVMLRGAGHCFRLERERETADALETFFRDLAEGPARPSRPNTHAEPLGFGRRGHSAQTSIGRNHNVSSATTATNRVENRPRPIGATGSGCHGKK